MKNPLVSILTPTYNHERFIGACIDGILAQTYPDWEMVIIDDGSTDRTPEVIVGYNDPRIRYFRQANQGIGRLHQTYEFALRHAHGDLVVILSGDDLWPPYRLEKQTPLFEDKSVVMCFGRGHIINERGAVISRPPMPRRLSPVLNRPVGSILRTLLVWNFIPSYTALLSMQAVKRMGGFPQPPGVLGVDSPTCLNLALQGEFRYIDLPLGYWRVHRNQHTNNFRMEQAVGETAYILRFFRSLDQQTQALTGWDEERLKKALRKELNNAYFEAGRCYLLSGDRRLALRYFVIALQRGAALTKGKALVGLACGLTGTDLERVARFVGRTALR